MRRLLLAGVLLVVAVLLQSTVVTRLGLPAGGPQLLVVVVATVGLLQGPTAGVLAGFGGGLLADLAPPSDHPLGQSALLLLVVGCAAGVAGAAGGVQRTGLLRAAALVAVLSVAVTLGAAAFGTLLGQPQPGWSRLLLGALAAGAYDGPVTLLLLPLLLPRRRREPRRARRRLRTRQPAALTMRAVR